MCSNVVPAVTCDCSLLTLLIIYDSDDVVIRLVCQHLQGSNGPQEVHGSLVDPAVIQGFLNARPFNFTCQDILNHVLQSAHRV